MISLLVSEGFGFSTPQNFLNPNFPCSDQKKFIHKNSSGFLNLMGDAAVSWPSEASFFPVGVS